MNTAVTTHQELETSYEAGRLVIMEGQLAGMCQFVRKRNEKWWRDLHTNEPIARNVGELLCLQHSEVSEAVDTDKSIGDLYALRYELDQLFTKKHIEAEAINNIHASISKAMEGHRKNKMDDKLPHRPMFEVEMADAVIRIMDTCAGLGFDLAGAWREKMEFNAVRKDHTHEARKAEGGKAY